MKRTICIVTGSRAEYGLLYPLIKEIKEDNELVLQLVVTGAHLVKEQGNTYQFIEEDGIEITEKVDMLLAGDSPTAISKSIGVGVIGFSDTLSRLNPDIIVLLGDRFELISIASVALIHKIPIAHIHGGEVTLGAYDDSIRHAITKLATIHFPSSNNHGNRIIQMGECPENVFVVGAPGVDNIKHLCFETKEELGRRLNIKWAKNIFVITFHPETMKQEPASGIHSLLNALEYYDNTTLIFTKANSDEDGQMINLSIKRFVEKDNQNRFLFDSLGQTGYLSVLKIADVAIGNSSSGLLEAPYLKTASVNIGNRQKGRERPISVLDAKEDEGSIHIAIEQALSFNFNKNDVQIFGDGTSAFKMKKVLKTHSFTLNLPFFDIKE